MGGANGVSYSELALPLVQFRTTLNPFDLVPLQTVEPQRLYRQIADQLRGLIGKGEFDVGARIPAERDLAKQLGVSRPSVREALIALEVEGWVEIRTGSGVYVLDRSHRTSTPASSTGAEWGPLEIIRARRMVEGETAATAAQHGKRKDVDAMRRAIQHDARDGRAQRGAARGRPRLPPGHRQRLRQRGADRDRAGFLGVAAGPDLRADDRLLRDHGLVAGRHRRARSHPRAIAARDPVAAREAMHQHMDKFHQRFSASWRRAKAS
jgi:DNA-binding FadR family transcriptional regulator